MSKGPLTNMMRRVLKRASENSRGRVSFAGVNSNGMKAFVTSLQDRGLITFDTGEWFLTDAGVAEGKS